MKITPTVCIFESLKYNEEDSYKEGEIICRTLRLSNVLTKYTYMRTRTELKRFAEAFGQSPHKILHLSCHANNDNFCLTLENVPYEELAEILGPHLEGCRLFISACRGTHQYFADQ